MRPDGSLGYFGPGTYTALATLTGYSHNHIARAGGGLVKSPGFEFVDKLSKAIGCSHEELLRYMEQRKGEVETKFKVGKDTVGRVLGYKGKGSTREVAKKVGVSRQTVSNIWGQ